MTNVKVSSILQTYDVYKAQRPASSTRTGKSEEKKDIVALSSQARDYKLVKSALADIPDIREDKIADVKGRYANGHYKAASGDIADKLLEKLASI